MQWIVGERLISGVHGDSVLHKCTKAVFEVAGLTLEREVVIDDSRDGSLVNCILPLDLGPLAKGKGGCRFLLTYVCLATRTRGCSTQVYHVSGGSRGLGINIR